MFVRTTENDDHHHVVYWGKNAQLMSINDDHRHPMELIPPVQPVLDMDTGEVIQGGEPAKLIIKPAEGHTHEILGELIKINLKDKTTKEEKVKKVKELYKKAKEYEKDFRRMGIESERFYRGDQWDRDTKAMLEKEDRAAITINHIEPKVDLLSGYHRQNRVDIKYLPVENGDSKVADILTALTKNITEQCSFDYEDTYVFEDMCITGRGLYHIYIDFDKNPLGDIIIEQYDWDGVLFAPHRKKDLSDCQYVLKDSWYSVEELDLRYPKFKGEFEKELDTDLTKETEAEIEAIQNRPGERYSEATGTVLDSIPTDDKDFVNRIEKEIKVVECQMKRYRKVPVIIFADDGFVENGTLLSKEDIDSIKTIAGIVVTERINTEMVITTIANNLMLSEFVENESEFNIIPAYAKKRGKHCWGKVEPVKDLNRETNKRRSQIIDIMNKAAAYGWFYDASTFRTPADAEEFKKNASRPGFVQEVNDVAMIPREVQGVRFPSEIANLEQMSTGTIREVMNINPEMMGLQSRVESGVAIEAKKRQGLIGNEFLFDNLSFAKRLLGRQILKFIQKVYTPDRMIRVLENMQQQPNSDNIKIGGQPLTNYSRQDFAKILATDDLSKYDVVVSESSYSPTKRENNFIVWSQMMKQGFPIPPEVLIDLSDLPEKDKIMNIIQQRQQQAEQLERDKLNTEILKTQIAKGGGGQQ